MKKLLKSISIGLIIILVFQMFDFKTNEVHAESKDTISPTAPTNLEAIANDSENSIVLSWSEATDDVGVTEYDVYAGGEVIASTAATTYTVQEVDPNVVYVFYVKAKDLAGNESQDSNKAMAKVNTIETKEEETTELVQKDSDIVDNVIENYNVSTINDLDLEDTEAPTVPTNLRVLSSTETTIKVGWDKSEDNVAVTGYEIYNGSTKVGEAIAEEFLLENLHPGTSYKLSVKAKDAAGNISELSEVLLAQTNEDIEAPTAPSNVSVECKSDTTVTLRWSESVDNIAIGGYDVYKNDEKIASLENITTYLVKDLSPDTEYNFSVKARDTSGNISETSEKLVVTTDKDITAPTIPTNLSITKTNGEVVLSWTSSVDNVGVTGYYIYNKDEKVGSTENETTYILNNLNADEEYYITVRAVDAAGNLSEVSETVLYKENDEIVDNDGNVDENVTDNSGDSSNNESNDNGLDTGDSGSNDVENSENTDDSSSDESNDTGIVDETDNNGSSESTNDDDDSIVTPETPNYLVSAPSELNVQWVGGWNVVLGWQAIDGEEIVYEVYQGDAKIAETSDDYYVVYGLKPNSKYKFKIRAKDNIGNYSDFTESDEITTYDDDYGNDLDNVTEIEVGKTINIYSEYAEDAECLTFIAPVSGEYTIWTIGSIITRGELCDELGEYIDSDRGNAEDGNFKIVVTLEAGKRYYLITEGYRGAIGKYQLNIATEDNIAPTKPMALKEDSKTKKSATISWSAATDNIAVYKYYIYKDGMQIATVDSDVLTYIDEGLAGGYTYKYTVRAVDIIGNISESSDVLEVAIEKDENAPSDPLNINSDISSNSVILSWDAGENAVSYDIERNGVIVANTINLTYEDTEVISGVEYRYRVRSRNDNGVSKWSDILVLSTNIETINQSNDFIMNNDRTCIDLNLTSGILDLNGHTLTVLGNLNQQGGTIKINGGKLIVKGNYTITGQSLLKMNNNNDYVLVNGDFTM